SHDRWFVSQLATRVVEITKDGIRDFPGTYEEYVHACGDDHLDADAVVLRAKREKSAERAASRPGTRGGGRPGQRGDHGGAPAGNGRALSPNERRRLEERRDRVTAELERAEARSAEIDATFCSPGYFQHA